MSTYSFPLGSDHDDYDAIRVNADLRALRGSGRVAGAHRGRLSHLVDLLSVTGSRHGSRTHHAAR